MFAAVKNRFLFRNFDYSSYLLVIAERRLELNNICKTRITEFVEKSSIGPPFWLLSIFSKRSISFFFTSDGTEQNLVNSSSYQFPCVPFATSEGQFCSSHLPVSVMRLLLDKIVILFNVILQKG